MNVYDFDKTIYDGDSTLDFFKYCLRKYPILYFYFFIQLGAFLIYKLGIIHKLKFKEIFYGFLKYIKNPESEVENFWIENHKKVKFWYLNQSQNNDVVISASPEFLLLPLCKKIGINYVIASIVDINTGRCLSENCYGDEKVIRFYKCFKGEKINEFYSDSYSDDPLAKISKKSFLVKGDDIYSWEELRL